MAKFVNSYRTNPFGNQGGGLDFSSSDFRSPSKAAGDGLDFSNTDFRSPADSAGNGLDFSTDDFRGQDPRTGLQTAGTTTIKSNPGFEDRRVRLRPMSADKKVSDLIFGNVEGNNARDNILAPLHPSSGKTNGLIFPYTPTIAYQYMADWSPQALVHTNYEVQTYARSYPTEITVTGLFTAQNQEEARYALAAIHFFRTITKMYFGNTTTPVSPGTPPPVLLFSGYGEGMFNDIPVVCKMFLHELLTDTDYVPVLFQKNKTAWVPAAFNITVTLGIQLNLRRTREEFDLDKFRTGELLGDKGNFARGRGGWL